MVGENLCHTASQSHARLEVQELVRPVGVRARAEDAGDDELRLGKALTEHRHERDRPTLTLEAGLAPEAVARGASHRLGEPAGEGRRVPAAGALLGFEA